MAKFRVEHITKPITSVPKLLTVVRKLTEKSPTGAVWLRGLSKSTHDLKPSIGREHTFAGKTFTFNDVTEERVFHRFRRYAYQHLKRPLPRWEAIILARHYGLPVRLMDWAMNPLAALYFACEYRREEELTDGKVWMLIPDDREGARINVFSPEKDKKGPIGPGHVKGIRLIYPMVTSDRINAQSGAFTVQQNPWISLDELANASYRDNDVDILELRAYTIPADKKSTMLEYLNSIGINRRTLFPDLDGLVLGLVNDQILRVKR